MRKFNNFLDSLHSGVAFFLCIFAVMLLITFGVGVLVPTALGTQAKIKEYNKKGE